MRKFGTTLLKAGDDYIVKTAEVASQTVRAGEQCFEYGLVQVCRNRLPSLKTEINDDARQNPGYRILFKEF